MDELGAFAYTYDSGSLSNFDFQRNEEPVVILGTAYSTLYDFEELKLDVLSRPWMTYRRGFSPIGGTGPYTDQGWGCMLRCGQMMLCQSLLRLHLPADWRWSADTLAKNQSYRRIMEMFLDKKSACYSIHQIASMGVAEGKDVGQWFGPNTIAQVLKKLAAYDSWSQLVIHVAMDNTVVVNDIRSTCRRVYSSSEVQLQFEAASSSDLPSQLSPHTSFSADQDTWRPLLLIVPLRLGLSNINDIYIPSLKRFFELPYTVGVIGGRPNHAHWFIGYTGDELVFLDPHTTQPVVDTSTYSEQGWDDSSYHCSIASRMKITCLDPSIALGFFCANEKEFESLIRILKREEKTLNTMFEVCEDRPRHWPPPHTGNPHGTDTVFTVVPSPKYDTDEEYELV